MIVSILLGSMQCAILSCNECHGTRYPAARHPRLWTRRFSQMFVDTCHDLTALQRNWRRAEVSDKNRKRNHGNNLVKACCGEAHLVVEQSSIQFDNHEAGCLRLNGHSVMLTEFSTTGWAVKTFLQMCLFEKKGSCSSASGTAFRLRFDMRIFGTAVTFPSSMHRLLWRIASTCLLQKTRLKMSCVDIRSTTLNMTNSTRPANLKARVIVPSTFSERFPASLLWTGSRSDLI